MVYYYGNLFDSLIDWDAHHKYNITTCKILYFIGYNNI